MGRGRGGGEPAAEMRERAMIVVGDAASRRERTGNQPQVGGSDSRGRITAPREAPAAPWLLILAWGYRLAGGRDRFRFR